MENAQIVILKLQEFGSNNQNGPPVDLAKLV